MALLDELAEFITQVTFDGLTPETVNQAKLHIFDSFGALLSGACTEEAKANRALVEELITARKDLDLPVPGFDFSAPLPLALLLSCAVTRLTETDDIDIASCTTVGSVIVPAALLFAFKTGATGRKMIEGVVTGYEVVTRLGAAVNGAEIIYRGLWPTYLCGAVGVASVGSKVMGLSVEQTRNALAISLTLSTGISGRVKTGLTSRWLTLGCAAQNGLVACLAASKGFAGDPSVLEGIFSSAYGLDLKPQVLLERLGKDFRIGTVNLKPYCSARQAISSIEAFRWLLLNDRIAPESIEGMEVLVPRQYSQMIDRPGLPDDRLGSITSLRYQLALAAFHEDDLYDIERKVLRTEPKIATFMQKVRVIPSDPLTAMYPVKWSGKVVLRAGGKKHEHEVLSPRGDSDQPMSWEDAEEKAGRIGRRFFDPEKIDKLGAAVKGLERMEKVDSLLHLLRQGS